MADIQMKNAMKTGNENRNTMIRWTVVIVLFAIAISQIGARDRELANARRKIDSLTASQTNLLALVSAADERASEELNGRPSSAGPDVEIKNLDDLSKAGKFLEETKKTLQAGP